MADNVFYKEAFVRTRVKDGALDLPFPVYAQRVYLDGVEVTALSLLEEQEVIASVDYMIAHQFLNRDDTPLVEAFPGLMTEEEFRALTEVKQAESLEE
jgi:hypothetical protein